MSLTPAYPFQVSVSLHAENRVKLLNKFKTPDVLPNSVILLQGGKSRTRYETDRDEVFRQESNFHWCFGVSEPDCFGAIEVDSGRTHLFFPRLPEAYAVWLGVVHPLSHFQSKYEVEACHYVDELDTVLSSLKPSILYLNHGLNTDSGQYAEPASFEGLAKYRVDNGKLYVSLSECRAIKSAKELDVMRYVSRVSSEAHVAVMRQCRPGLPEFYFQSLFTHETHARGGCRHQAYQCICGAGENGAVLHYLDADAVVKDGGLFLLDMGGEYYCYASDITCTIPISGKFTEKQKPIYETVLRAQEAVEAAMKPGVSWTDMHLLAERVIMEGLLAEGLVKGSMEELMANRIPALFMPHGLGHLLGLDVHDVGGYTPGTPARLTEPGLKSLRTRRILEPGMVITVEPGIYFIRALLEPAMKDPVKSKFLNCDKLPEYLDFGGVRLEDDVAVTETGIENFTKVPRTVAQVEACMAGLDWENL